MAFHPARKPLIRPAYILAIVDSHLKERLVGAVVLVAAAVILIPEMLSGPADRPVDTARVERTTGEGIKTYTIDLGNRARSGAEAGVDAATDAVVETVAPPPEEAPAAAPAASPATSERSSPEPAPQAQATPPAVASVEPAIAPVEKEPPPAVRPAPAAKLPWAVQVGSFASQATADRLSQDLKRRGYPSFVVPFKSGAQTLFRVRIGPMQERSAADAAVQKLKRDGTREGAGATVVANS